MADFEDLPTGKVRLVDAQGDSPDYGADGSYKFEGTQEDGSTTFDNPILFAGEIVDPTSPNTGTIGQIGRVQINDANKALLVSLADGLGPTNDQIGIGSHNQSTGVYELYKSSALEPSGVLKATAKNLYRIHGKLDAALGANIYYLQIIDASSVPADGAVTMIDELTIEHGGTSPTNFDLDFRPASVRGSNGLVYCISTTEFTKTVIVTNHASVTAYMGAA